jgi:hypothetical protein
LPIDIETKASEIKELESRRRAAEKAALEAETHRDKVLKSSNQTVENLPRFNKVEEKFAHYGMPLKADTLEKAVNLVGNAAEVGYDVKSIVVKISQNRSLEERKATLQSDMSRKEEQLHEIDRILEEHRREIGKHSELVETIRDADKMGFGSPHLKIILSGVRKAGVENGTDAATSMHKFIEDVSIGLGSKMSFAKAAEEEHKRYQELKAKNLDAQKYYNANKEAVDSIVKLHVKKVIVEDIVSLKNIILGSGTSSVKDLEVKIRQHLIQINQKNYSRQKLYGELAESIFEFYAYTMRTFTL